MSDNGKAEEYISRKDILICAVKGEEGKIDFLFDFKNLPLIKATVFDLNRIIANIANQVDMENAKKESESKIVTPGMAETQRRFK